MTPTDTKIYTSQEINFLHASSIHMILENKLVFSIEVIKIWVNLPRSWWRVRRQHTASICWARSTMLWWCRCGRGCGGACHRWGPTASPSCPYHQTRTGSHQGKPSPCSGSLSVRGGWSSACSWSSARPG